MGRFARQQIVTLSGPLGVGKTQWVHYCVSALGLAAAHSPTYSVINQYSDQCFHVDLYRLDSADEIVGVGFWDLFSRDQGLVFIEWPERLGKDELPLDWNLLEITLAFADKPHSRQVTVL